MVRFSRYVILPLLWLFVASKGDASHGISLYGKPALPKDFKHFPYANPNAPKGGEIKLAALGTFDSLNPYTIQGITAAGLSIFYASPLTVTLTMHSLDEPFTEYCFLAESVEMAKDRKSITYTLRTNAKFHDGSAITADDVIFSFNTLKAKGAPIYNSYYSQILSVEKVGKNAVRFNFKSDRDRELGLIVGHMPIISKAFYTKNDLKKSSLKIPLGNGPYKIESVNPGKSITYRRVKKWWGDDLPVTKGMYNFDKITYIYFQDPTVAFEAFKSGDVDVRVENIAKNWAEGYDIDAVKDGDIIKESIKDNATKGMAGFVFNTRKQKFLNAKVRHAIALLFDFEWMNEALFHSYYKRSNSYFSNSDLASRGLPKGEELEILDRFKEPLPREVFEKKFEMPVNKGRQAFRQRVREAYSLLKAAGFDVVEQKVINKETGEPLEFEILIANSAYLRITNAFVDNLKRAGILTKVRMVDASQFEERIEQYDFDMVYEGFGQSNSPGNELYDFWGSQFADKPGGRNICGIKDAVIDQLIELVVHAPDRESLVQRVRALDRVLLWGWYVVPGYHNDSHWIARWKHIVHPETMPKNSVTLDTWWHAPVEKKLSK